MDRFVFQKTLLFVLLLYVPSQQLWSWRVSVSSPNHTFSWANLNKQLTSTSCSAHTFVCNWQQPFLNDSAEGRRMTIEIISRSISAKLWDRTGIKLSTPGSAVRLASVTRHVTNCSNSPMCNVLHWLKYFRIQKISTGGVLASFFNHNWAVQTFSENQSNSFLRGVHTSISKETYNHLWFSRQRGGVVWTPCLPLWICPCFYFPFIVTGWIW